MLDIIGSLEGSLHLHLPHLHLFHKGSCVSSPHSPVLTDPFFSCPCLILALCFRCFFAKQVFVSLQFQSPFAMLCTLSTGKYNGSGGCSVWPSGKVSVLLLTCAPVLYFSTWVQSISRDISVCVLLLGYLFFFWLNANVAKLWGAENFGDSAWVGKARFLPPPGC